MESSRLRRATFRVALQTALAKAFKAAGLEIPFTGGRIEGPSTDRELGCVWMETKVPQAADGNNEEVTYFVRVFRVFRLDQGAASPRVDVNDELERTFELLEDALRANLTRPWLQLASGVDLTSEPWFEYFNVARVRVDHTMQYVEAQLVVRGRNRTARGG